MRMAKCYEYYPVECGGSNLPLIYWFDTKNLRIGSNHENHLIKTTG